MYSFGVIPLCQFSERARAGDTYSAENPILVCFGVSDENNDTPSVKSYMAVSFVHVVRCH